MHPKSFKPVLPHESTISTYMRYSFTVLRKCACAISNFQNKLLFCVFVSLAERWRVANIFHARCVILKMSVYSLVIAQEYGKGIRVAQSRNEKWIYFMLSNNKFLGKCWYGGHPCIRLAMESESNGGKRNKLYFLFGNRLWCIAWKVLGALSRFHWWQKYASQKYFYLSI